MAPRPKAEAPGPARPGAIVAEGITRRFGTLVAVDHADLRVEYGEVFGFLGPNGSGKTTMIKMLTGLLPVNDGVGWVDGLDVRTAPEQVRERIGYMSQRFSLYDDLAVQENLEFYGRVYGLTPARLRERKEFLIPILGLEPFLAKPAGKLSGGWKQRLALGCALLHEPRILFLDEPTAGIDPVARRQLWDLLFELSGQGITFFVTTHYMDEAERCSHVAYIYYGRIIADGTPDALKAMPEISPAGTRRIEITAPEITRALRLVRGTRGMIRATVFGQAIHALVEENYDQSAMQAELAHNGIAVTEVRPLAPSLEDVFVELTLHYQAELEVARG